jgi:hypothetical protein
MEISSYMYSATAVLNMAFRPYLPGVFAFSFYGKRKGLAKRKTRHARRPGSQGSSLSCRIHAALCF